VVSAAWSYNTRAASAGQARWGQVCQPEWFVLCIILHLLAVLCASAYRQKSLISSLEVVLVLLHLTSGSVVIVSLFTSCSMMIQGRRKVVWLYIWAVGGFVCVSVRVRHSRITEHSSVIAEDVLLLAPLAFVLESLLWVNTHPAHSSCALPGSGLSVCCPQ
jgi:hypothetical protein